ncbi:MAG TPA: hypothetical protein VH619_05570 [Verrucomicrobiae bacterium]|jgi:hypothetical protein|nr:hypothetical protein [Verrucomicrobiae bacterium]
MNTKKSRTHILETAAGRKVIVEIKSLDHAVKVSCRLAPGDYKSNVGDEHEVLNLLLAVLPASLATEHRKIFFTNATGTVITRKRRPDGTWLYAGALAKFTPTDERQDEGEALAE